MYYNASEGRIAIVQTRSGGNVQVDDTLAQEPGQDIVSSMYIRMKLSHRFIQNGVTANGVLAVAFPSWVYLASQESSA